MPLFGVAIDDFAGLDIRDAADETGGALDVLNVEFDRPGRVRSRDGYSKVTSSAGATRYDSLFPVSGASSVSSAASTPGTMADDNSHGTVAWSPTALPASVTLTTGQISHYLKATNFGFAIPSTATVVGVAVSVTYSGGPAFPGADLLEQSVKLVKAGSITGTDHSVSGGASAGYSPRVWGGSSDMWGITLTPTNVNASTFGMVLALTTYPADSGTIAVSGITVTVYYQPIGNVLVAGAAGSRLDVIATDGTVAATTATASDTRQSYVAFGSPSTSAVYIANSGVTMRKLVGTTFTQPAGMPKAKFVGLQTPDNRLVAANIGTVPTGSNATASTSLVVFSDAGYPEVWNDTGDGLRSANGNHYVYLTPGDNEDIKGVVTWRNQTFIFKGSQFFVFYGNSTDNTGQPVFNYRAVTGAGLVTDQAACASPDGVYFLDRRGIYFTTGGPAQRISTPLDPLFIGGNSGAYYQAGQINPSAFAQARMSWYNGRLYIGLPLGTATTNDHTLVFDPATGMWTLWDIPMGAMTASLSQPGLLYFTYATGTNDIGQYAPNAYTDDAGSAITSRYRSAFLSLDWRGRTLRSGIHGVEKIVRESLVEGWGAVSYTVSKQWVGASALPTARSLTLGTAPQVSQARDRTAVKGRAFSFQVSSSTAWQVEQIIWNIHGYEDAGLQETGP